MGEWVDFKAIKQQVTMQLVLERYGIKLRRSGKELRGRCPIHRGKGIDAFHVSPEKNVFHCFSCQAKGNVLDFVAAMEQCTVREAGLKLQGWFAVPQMPVRGSGKTASEPQLATKKVGERAEVEATAANKPLGFVLKRIDPSHPYLASRGISRQTAETFGVGFFPGKGSMTGRVVIPIHNANGELVAYTGRAVDDSEPKYKLPTGFKKALELFNLHRVTGEEVILVEGYFDCMKVYQAGFPNVVALMGSSLSEVQEALLARFRYVTLLLDGDAAGRAATAGIAMRLVLSGRHWVRAVELEEGKQPDMLTPEEIAELLKGKVGG